MQLDVYTVPVRVSMPAGTPAIVKKMLEKMIGEAQTACGGYIDSGKIDEDSALADSVHRILHSEFAVGNPQFECSEGTDLDCNIDCDQAAYIGNEDDGCYYQVFEDENGDWWLSVIVDCQTSGFSQSLADGDGPYDTEHDAKLAGFMLSKEWCEADGVNWEIGLAVFGKTDLGRRVGHKSD